MNYNKLLKADFFNLLLVSLALTVILRIVFYKQDFLTTLRISLSLLWMFVYPGYALLHYWHEKLDFGERVVVGSALAAGVIAIAGYYLGLLGIHVKFQTIILPSLMFLVAFVIRKVK